MLPVVGLYVGLGVAALGLVSLARPRAALGMGTPGRAAAVVLAGGLLAAVAAAAPAPERRAARPSTHLDAVLPRYQFGEYHATRVAAPPEAAFRAVQAVTADEIRGFQTLTALRRLGRDGPESILRAPGGRPLLDVATRTTFLRLAEAPGHEVVVGSVVLAPAGWRRERAATPAAFRALTAPGFARAAMNFRVTPDGRGGSIVSTETRVHAAGDAARRRFALYWRVIYPGSAIIRRSWLGAIRRRAERDRPLAPDPQTPNLRPRRSTRGPSSRATSSRPNPPAARPAASPHPMPARLAHVALLVADYDEAIAYYTAILGFTLAEDTPAGPDGKRWVVVAPPGGGAALLLARAATPAQRARVGDQAGGRVFLFLHTDDFARDHAVYAARGVRFVEPPRAEPYGTVAVFEDPYGNRWDLVGPPTPALPAEPDPPLLYGALAPWWPLMSAPAEYAEEAAFFAGTLAGAGDRPPRDVLELGSGGGNIASYLKARFAMTLVDRAPGMLAVSRALNPECGHAEGDLRTVRLGRTFDAVFVHDAICYMATEADLRRALATAYAHCRPGGGAVFAPDHLRETFRPSTDSGGNDAPDGRGLRYLEWVWDPDPADSTYLADYAYLVREAGGATRVVHDRHVEGLFSRADWLRLLAEVGFEARAVPVVHGDAPPESMQEMFVARRPPARASR